jgi:magnesium-transporting ATPase (P-type)
MAYAGATVMTGRGTGLIVATGTHTEVGKIARAVTEEKGALPPLVTRMERFARQISVIVLAFAALLGIVSFNRGMPLDEVFILVIAMAVSAIPEGLPIAMTVALSLAAGRMARRHVIVRRLTAVESLESCTAVASDKTGTLTVNQQTVKLLALPEGSVFEVSGQGYNGTGEVRRGGERIPDTEKPRLERIGLASSADTTWPRSARTTPPNSMKPSGGRASSPASRPTGNCTSSMPSCTSGTSSPLPGTGSTTPRPSGKPTSAWPWARGPTWRATPPR